MRLLILTQKVDRNDDVLGFMHGWINEFAKKCEKITVICLKKGEVSLPANVKVLSLGKETVESRVKYLVNFYKYIFQERKNYDAVFVHMNPEYVVLGGLPWKLFGKKISLWYVHKKVSWRLKLAEKLVDKIFTVSEKSINLKSKKITGIGHGINLDLFRKLDVFSPPPDSVLYLGRISPVKKIENLIKAAGVLNKKGVNFNLDIVGNPVNKEDFEYEARLKQIVGEGVLFLPAVKNREAPEIYNHHELTVNLTPTGSFDKVILEAMACERLVLVCNKSFEEVLPSKFLFQEKDSQDLAKKLEIILDIPQNEKVNYGKQFREYVIKNHNLEKFVQKLISHF